MNKPTIDAMTWATLVGALVSACSLAGGDAALPDHRLLSVLAGSADPEPLPSGALAGHAPAAVSAQRRPPPPASGPRRALSHVPQATPASEKV